MKQKTPLTTEWLPTDQVKPHPQNAREHSTGQIKRIANSITAHGANVPMLVDKDGFLVAGHGRLMAFKSLGWKLVPIIRLNHLSKAAAKAFMIADNRLVDLSTFNEVKLGELFQEILAIPDLDVEDTGFDLPEIELLINGAASVGGPDAADQNIETPAALAVSQLGDGWHLDKNRVFCGDARDLQTIRTLMGRKRASASFLDVPYNVRIHGHVGGKGLIQHREFAMASGEMTPEQYREFLRDALELVARFSMDGSVHFVCIDWRHLVDASAACADAFESQLNLCTWIKTNAGMGSFYRSQHELILVYKKGTASHCNNIQLGKYGRSRSNVWNYPGANSFARGSEEGNLLALHPTVKPIQLVADAILDCTIRGEIVLDTFLGSGSTLIAAERTSRILYGTEIDPLYVDVVIRRWQRHTGGQAIHATTGQRFDDIAATKGGGS